MLEKKDINKYDWKRILKRCDMSCDIIKNNEVIGVAKLIHIIKVTKPLSKKYENGKDIKVVDDGYYWLQIGLKDVNYWITSMYDSKGSLIQYYIDITYKNVIASKKEAFFYDLFLDIVLLKNGRVFLLDEDELNDALNSKKITKKQFELASNEAKKILNSIRQNEYRLNQFCFKYFKILKNNLEK